MADEQNVGTGTSDHGANGAAAAAADAGASSAAPAPSIALADLTAAGIPDSYIKDGALDAKALAASLSEGTALKTAADERAKGVPADGKYDFALPKDFKLPEGMQVSPEFLKSWAVSEAKQAGFAAFAKSAGYSQKEVSDFIGAYAAADAADKMAQAKANLDATAASEKATKDDALKVLGPNFMSVIETTRNAWQAFAVEHLGKEAGEALAKNTGFQSAGDIKAMNDLMNAVRTKLASSVRAGGADDKNAEAAALVGKQGGGSKLLQMANSKPRN